MKPRVPRVLSMKLHIPSVLSMKIFTDDLRLMPDYVFCCVVNITAHSEFSALRKMCSFHAQNKLFKTFMLVGPSPVCAGVCVASPFRLSVLTDRQTDRQRDPASAAVGSARTTTLCPHPLSKCKVTGRRQVLTSDASGVCSCVGNWTTRMRVASTNLYAIIVTVSVARSCSSALF
jgi:hypothetical protein